MALPTGRLFCGPAGDKFIMVRLIHANTLSAAKLIALQQRVGYGAKTHSKGFAETGMKGLKSKNERLVFTDE